jgi:hypothetical protein
LVCHINYCAGAAGAGAGAGAGSAGLLASGVAGFIVWSDAGGLVLCVVVVSVPLSLQAATPSNASAETDARISFFMIISPLITPPLPVTVEETMHQVMMSFVTLRFRV